MRREGTELEYFRLVLWNMSNVEHGGPVTRSEARWPRRPLPARGGAMHGLALA